MIKRLALSALEKSVNACLRLDPDSQDRLSVIEDKVIQFSVTDCSVNFFLVPTSSGVVFSFNHKGDPDTVISGTFCALGKLSGVGDGCGGDGVDVIGDVSVVETLHHVLAHLDIDWEEGLSKITGDMIAHRVGLVVSDGIAFGKDAGQAVAKNIEAYLKYESDLLPTQKEVDAFYDEVNTLRHDVDRLEARMNRLFIKKG